MKALRLIQKVSKDGYLENVKVSHEMGEQVELIILPAPKSSEMESYSYCEDVWNDI